MSRSRTSLTRLFRMIPVALCLLSTTGCLSGRHFSFGQVEHKAQNYQVKYSVRDAMPELDPWSSFADQEFQTANWSSQEELSPVSTQATQSAELKIEFPHPERGDEYALATLKVYPSALPDQAFTKQEKKPWYKRWLRKPWSHHEAAPVIHPSEIITLELPRSQFDLLMSDLSDKSYMADEKHHSPVASQLSDANLEVTKNSETIHSSFVADHRLDELLQRVYREGEVILGERSKPQTILRTSAVVEAPAPAVR